jgi:hypothetical protein
MYISIHDCIALHSLVPAPPGCMLPFCGEALRQSRYNDVKKNIELACFDIITLARVKGANCTCRMRLQASHHHAPTTTLQNEPIRLCVTVSVVK